MQAKKLLDCPEPKWDPCTGTNHNGLDLMAKEKTANEMNRDLMSAMRFDPKCETGSDITKVFHIFTCPRREAQDIPALCMWSEDEPSLKITIETGSITAYTAGYCLEENTTEARAGCGMWFGQADERNTALRAPGEIQTRHAGEIATIRAVTPDTKLEIVMNSPTIIKLMTTSLEEHEKR